MKLRVAFFLIACSGCHFAVDAVDVMAGDGSTDLSGSVDDLAFGGDLTNPPDLTAADLSTSDLRSGDLLPAGDMTCSPALFTGFAAGVTSIDCRRCGCILDDFTSFSGSRWTRTVSSGWSDAMAGGTLTFSAGSLVSASSDTLSSDGHFYIQGDFDVSVDYQMVSWPTGVGQNLNTLGPANTAPTVFAHTYQSAMKHLLLEVDNAMSDTTTTATQGTFRIARVGNNICTQLDGSPPQCRAPSEVSSVAVALQVNFYDANCGSPCPTVVETRLKNLKLNTGVISALP